MDPPIPLLIPQPFKVRILGFDVLFGRQPIEPFKLRSRLDRSLIDTF
jgi:hypothetical protein